MFWYVRPQYQACKQKGNSHIDFIHHIFHTYDVRAAEMDLWVGVISKIDFGRGGGVESFFILFLLQSQSLNLQSK